MNSETTAELDETAETYPELVRCPACGTGVSKRATQCRRCGEPMRPQQAPLLMDTTGCPTCGMGVSKRARRCPRCGDPVNVLGFFEVLRVVCLTLLALVVVSPVFALAVKIVRFAMEN